MATNLTDIIKKVRTALRGEEVRGSIADGLEYCGQISENAKADMKATASAAKEAMNKTASDAKTTIETSAASTKEQLSKDIDAKAAAALKSIPESYTELDGSVKQLKEDLDELCSDILYSPKFEDGKFIGTKGQVSKQVNFTTSEPFYVENGQLLLVKAKGYLNNVSIVTKTTQSGEYIESLYGDYPHFSSDYKWWKIPIKSGCYVRISSDNRVSITILSRRNIAFELDKIGNCYYANVFNTALCIGDSITKGFRKSGVVSKEKSYPQFLQNISGITTINAGVAGFTAKDWYTNWSDSYISDSYTYDIAIIKLGQNGGLTDTIDEDCKGDNYTQWANTNTGCYCKIIEKLKTIKPTTKIFLVSIRANAIDTNNVIKKIAQKYKLPYIDLGAYKYDLDNSRYHISSGGESYDVHFNTIGYLELAKAISEGIENWVYNNQKDYYDFL